MTQPPLPSQLTFISELPSTEPGTKVRIHGCITATNPTAPTLTLTSQYPSHHLRTTCPVSLSTIAPTLSKETLAIGTWVNVVGYVNRESKGGGAPVTVEAIALWDVGVVSRRVAVWEDVVGKRRRAVERMRGAREGYEDGR